MEKVDFEELKKLNYEKGAELLTAAGYVNFDSIEADAEKIAQFVSDDYWVLYNDDGDKIDMLSWVEYYNLISDIGEHFDVVREGWERVE